MLPRLAQSLWTLLAAGVAWFFLSKWLDPQTAAIIVAAAMVQLRRQVPSMAIM